MDASTAIAHRQQQPKTAAAPDCAPTQLIRDLRDIGEGEAALVGGKAYPLAMLMRRGFRVPSGFCITAEAFRLAGGCEASEIALPPLLREQIIAAWRNADFAVAAVRSSAAEEDGREASWAGIFPTVLMVEDEAALIDAVERCFRAVHAPEAKLYRSQAIAGGPPPAMAVLVQQLVEAEAAGMVFTSNPVSGARDEIVINAVHGLGSALAAGTVSGDTFVVHRDGTIKTQKLCAKQVRMTRSGELQVPREQQEIPAVCSRAIAAIAKIAIAIEDLFGCPQDIEFAIAGDAISILQARPITGLQRDSGDVETFITRERRRLAERIAALRCQGVLRGQDAVFSNGNIGELLPTPTPMSFGIFREIFAGRGGAVVAGRRALGYQLSDDCAEALFELICGQAFFNLEVDAGTFNIGLPVDVDEIIRRVSEDSALANYPEFGLYKQVFEADSSGICTTRSRELTRGFHAKMVAAGQSLLQRFASEIEPSLRVAVAEARQELAADLSVPGLVDAIARRIEALKRGACVQFVMAARLGFYFAEMVRSRLLHYTGDAALTPQLLQGLEGSRITHQALDLERLASGQMTRAAFLAAYGHLAANELEISLPRLAEEPVALDCLLEDLAASGRHPGSDFQQQQRRRESAERELDKRLAAANLSPEQSASIHVDLRLAQDFLPLRETVKYYYAAEYAVIRSLLLRLNDAIGWQPNDIFYLLAEEVPDCAAKPDALRQVIARRRLEHRLAGRIARQHSLPAVVFGSRLEEIGAPREYAAAERLTGTPVASGCAVGTVRIVDCADGAALKDLHGDEIIVARSANLGLAPVMRMAAGLIVEVGGVLAHAACQARESGIPAVVLPNAMLALRSGMKVRLDGESGTVELLQVEVRSCAAPAAAKTGDSV